MYHYRATTDSRTGTFLLFEAGPSASSDIAPIDPEAAFRFALIGKAALSHTDGAI